MATDDQSIIEFVKSLKGELDAGKFDTVVREYIRVVKQKGDGQQQSNNEIKKTAKADTRFEVGVFFTFLSIVIICSISFFKDDNWHAMAAGGFIAFFVGVCMLLGCSKCVAILKSKE